MPVPFCLSCSACPVLSFIICLSRSFFPVLLVSFFLSLLLCLPRSVFPDLPVPFFLSSSACPLLSFLFRLSRFLPSFSACLFLTVLFWLSYSACPILPVLFSLFSYGQPVCLSWTGFPVLAFLSLLFPYISISTQKRKKQGLLCHPRMDTLTGCNVLWQFCFAAGTVLWWYC
jgi:hypothetical protein